MKGIPDLAIWVSDPPRVPSESSRVVESFRVAAEAEAEVLRVLTEWVGRGALVVDENATRETYLDLDTSATAFSGEFEAYLHHQLMAVRGWAKNHQHPLDSGLLPFLAVGPEGPQAREALKAPWALFSERLAVALQSHIDVSRTGASDGPDLGLQFLRTDASYRDFFSRKDLVDDRGRLLWQATPRLVPGGLDANRVTPLMAATWDWRWAKVVQAILVASARSMDTYARGVGLKGDGIDAQLNRAMLDPFHPEVALARKARNQNRTLGAWIEEVYDVHLANLHSFRMYMPASCAHGGEGFYTWNPLYNPDIEIRNAATAFADAIHAAKNKGGNEGSTFWKNAMQQLISNICILAALMPGDFAFAEPGSGKESRKESRKGYITFPQLYKMVNSDQDLEKFIKQVEEQVMTGDPNTRSIQDLRGVKTWYEGQWKDGKGSKDTKGNILATLSAVSEALSDTIYRVAFAPDFVDDITFPGWGYVFRAGKVVAVNLPEERHSSIAVTIISLLNGSWQSYVKLRDSARVENKHFLEKWKGVFDAKKQLRDRLLAAYEQELGLVRLNAWLGNALTGGQLLDWPGQIVDHLARQGVTPEQIAEPMGGGNVTAEALHWLGKYLVAQDPALDGESEGGWPKWVTIPIADLRPSGRFGEQLDVALRMAQFRAEHDLLNSLENRIHNLTNELQALVDERNHLPNTERYGVWMVDEYHKFCQGLADAEYAAVSRSCKALNCIATQAPSSVRTKMESDDEAKNLFSNFPNRVILRQTEADEAEAAAKLIGGKEHVLLTERSVTENMEALESSGHGAGMGGSIQVSRKLTERWLVEPTYIQRQWGMQAVGCAWDGGKPFPARAILVKPDYLFSDPGIRNWSPKARSWEHVNHDQDAYPQGTDLYAFTALRLIQMGVLDPSK